MCSLVISIFLYACESWTLTAVREKNAGLLDEMLPKAFEHFVQGSCYRLPAVFSERSKQLLGNIINS